MSLRSASTTATPENRAPSRLAVGGRARDPRASVPAVLRQVGDALRALADLLEQSPPLAADLLPLRALPCSPRAARAAIARGQLPAVRVGREYRVARADVEALFAPKARAPKQRRIRETETARERRQLREAGIELRPEAP